MLVDTRHSWHVRHYRTNELPYSQRGGLPSQSSSPVNTIGGKAIQTVQGIDIILDNGFNVNAKFCPQSNLPLMPLSLKNNRKYCFWNDAFWFWSQEFPRNQYH